MSVELAYRTVKDNIDKIVNDADHQMDTMEEMDEWRQGDVRVIRLPDDFDIEEHCILLKEIPIQLAPGNTLGSRHCLDSIEGVTAYKLIAANNIDGPVLQLSETRSVIHPEHGNCKDLPVGKYAFPGQRVQAEEIRRTRD